MTELNEQHDIFVKHLKKFDLVLLHYRYKFQNSFYANPSVLPLESMFYIYAHAEKNLTIQFSFIINRVKQRKIEIEFRMNDGEMGFFLLHEYQKRHQLEHQIETAFSDSCDFGEAMEKFFADLKLAFETHLNDQISGLTFERHNDLGLGKLD